VHSLRGWGCTLKMLPQHQTLLPGKPFNKASLAFCDTVVTIARQDEPAHVAYVEAWGLHTLDSSHVSCQCLPAACGMHFDPRHAQMAAPRGCVQNCLKLQVCLLWFSDPCLLC
jgi:hypothetical protein